MTENIKKSLKEIPNNFKQVTAGYPFTWILVIIISTILSVFIDQSGPAGRFMGNKMIPFLLLWCIGTWFSETSGAGNRRRNLIGILSAGAAAFALVYFSLFGSQTVKETASRWEKAYAVILMLLGIYRNYQLSGQPFARYCARIVHELSRLAIVCVIVAGGISLVAGVFVTLLLDESHLMLVVRAEILVIGCLAGIGFLSVLIRLEADLSQFYVRIFRFLLLPLLLAAFLIVYCYILKIMITGNVPSNEIFRILAGLFILGLPIWTIIDSFPEDSRLLRIGIKLPYVFVPFLFLQGYSIFVRIREFGLTPSRCFGLALMLFEVIYLITYALLHRENAVILPAAAALTVLCVMIPGINVYSLSNRSQKAIFDRYIENRFDELPSGDQSSLAGAFYFLSGTSAGKDLLSDVPQNKIDAIVSSGKTGMPEFDESLIIYQEFPVLQENIGDYSSMTVVSTTYQDHEWQPAYDPEAIGFYTPDGRLVFTADISRFINVWMASDPDERSGSEELPYLIRPDDESVFRLTYCSLTVLPDKSIRYPELRGILFEK